MHITRSPQTISNATLGSTVRFECQINSTSLFPQWNINGRDYIVTDLPLGYEFKSVSYSKVLIVSPVEQAMNNSVYYCFLFVPTPEGLVTVNSSQAMLIIVPLHSGYSSKQCVLHDLEDTGLVRS